MICNTGLSTSSGRTQQGSRINRDARNHRAVESGSDPTHSNSPPGGGPEVIGSDYRP